MLSLNPTQTLVLDMLPCADRINACDAGQFFIPPIHGVYLRGRQDPVLHPNETYCRRIFEKNMGKRTSQNKSRSLVDLGEHLLDQTTHHAPNDENRHIEKMIPINIWDPIVHDVYNANGELVLPKHQHRFLMTEPSVPIIALQVLETLAKATIEQLSQRWLRMDNPETRFETRRKGDDFTNIEILLKPFFVNNLTSTQYNNATSEIISEAACFQTQIAQFIGSDQWIMHFGRRRGTNLVVEKTIDYRIYAWEKENAKRLPPEEVQIRNAVDYELAKQSAY